MKKWALHFLIFMFFIFEPVGAKAFENHLPGARSAAMAGATVALPGSEALFQNPSSLSYEEKLSFILSYESRFLMKELSLMAAGIILPTRSGTFGGSYIRFGTGVYQENRIGLVYAKKLGKLISAAVGFDYLSVTLPENSRPFSALTVESGLTAGIPGKYTGALYVFNPVMAKLKLPGGKVPVPWSVRVGNTWFINNWLLLCSELDFTPKKPAGLHTGLEFNPSPEISVRAGISGCPFQITAGAGFKMGNVVFDIAFSHHGYLGFSPTAGIRFTP